MKRLDDQPKVKERMAQKIIEEAKRMNRDVTFELKRDYLGQVSNVAVSVAQI